MNNSTVPELHNALGITSENEAVTAYDGHGRIDIVPQANTVENRQIPIRTAEFNPISIQAKPEGMFFNGGTSDKPKQSEVVVAEQVPAKPKAVEGVSLAKLTDGVPHFQGEIDPFLTAVTPKSIRRSAFWTQIWNIVSKPR